MRSVLRCVLLVALAAPMIVPATAETPPVGRPSGAKAHPTDESRKVTPEQRLAVERGLRYLARAQEKDGSWSANPAPIAVTSLCTLAFLAGGNTESRGRYSSHVRKALDYLLTHVDQRPGFEQGFIRYEKDQWSRMHGHGYATLALAEAYGGIQRDPRLSPERRRVYRRKLEMAVRLIERAQERRWGGWDYFPRGTDSHEGSITVCQIQALRAARNAGIRVDPDTIRRALDYVRKSQKKDGGFVYSLKLPKRASYELTAAAVSTLNGIGDYGSEAYTKGLDYLMRHLDSHLLSPMYLFYGDFYAAQAMWQASPSTGYWNRYWPRVRRKILESETRDPKTGRPTGKWDPGEVQRAFDAGRDYGTAMACLILQIPYGYLPLFQR
jgi:hypothetical protein